jgi:hypothetical protein
MVRNIQHDSLVPCAAFPKVEHCRCSYLFLFVLVIFLGNSRVHNQNNSVEGFIMDKICIDLGYLLDNPSVRTLENPGVHTFHWYVNLVLFGIVECIHHIYGCSLK